MDVHDALRSVGRGEGIVSFRQIDGGLASRVWHVTYLDGSTVIAKTLSDAPPDVYASEVDGLAALRATGNVRIPAVLSTTETLLVLEALPPREDSGDAWEALARDLASLYQSTIHDRFGWHRDGYCGLLPQRNPWTEDGHAFFAEHRLLRYLEEPITHRVLDEADRRAIERLCDRLPELIPTMPPVLTHGDLWANNLVGSDGRLALIDPAVSFTWAEVDLAMLHGCPRPPASDRFFPAYQELNPSPDGWQKRMPLLFVRELLAYIAHAPILGLSDTRQAVDRLRYTLAPFRIN